MLIDNFAILRQHLRFNNSDEFYFVQIIQRRKDGNEGLHVRNAKEAALECIKRYTDLVLNNNAFQGNNIWDSVCGGYKALDVDNPDLVEELVRSCKHNESFVMYRVPTVHGFHLICNGFDTKQFNSLLKDKHLDTIDIHKNNPTLLYYNDLSSKPKQGTV